MKLKRIICAPDSFKESMSALEAARAMARGVHRVFPDVDCVLVPMADGGEGTAETLVDALGGEMVSVECVDALGRAHSAEYGIVSERKLAVIEMAAASGLAQIAPAERRILEATTYGVGELILDALDRGARTFILGIGGSATNDAGAGMAAALGVKFLDSAGKQLPLGGGALARLAQIDLTG
ncbi:MAG: glycerate kinase, partial [Propionibacteriaceae bacterium]|nr:glycerate kinase [Propionibacteriaceae bacterium]